MLLHEFDPDPDAILNPHEIIEPVPGFPEICIGVFSEDVVGDIVTENDCTEITAFRTACGDHSCYKGNFHGVNAALFNMIVGAPAAAGILEEAIAMGGKYFVFFGCCGVLRRDIPDGDIILPTAALRDEGVSYHYLPAQEEVAIPPEAILAAESVFARLKLPYIKTKTWTTSAFYRETRKKMRRRIEQGCGCVEMECAALAAVAQFRNVAFSQFLFAADNLDSDVWERRGLGTWGETGAETFMHVAVEIGKRLAGCEII